MRIWLVPIQELSDLHILGQHKEMHLFFSMLINPRFEKHPLVIFYKDKGLWLKKFHDDVVAEMAYRFGSPPIHATPTPLWLTTGLSEWDIPEEWIHYDRVDLAYRVQHSVYGKYKWKYRDMPDYIEEAHDFSILDGIPLQLAMWEKLSAAGT